MTDYEHVIEFFKRTQAHICRVQECALELVKSNNYSRADAEILLVNAARHDASKFSADERHAYTTYYHEMNEGDRTTASQFKSGVWRTFQRAWKHHQVHNAHHPQHWEGREHSMPLPVILEMVSDWAAMSRELGDSLHDWVERMYGKWNIGDFKDIIDAAVGILENDETIERIEVTMATVSNDERKIVGEVLIQMSTMLKKWDSHEMVMASDFRDHNVPGWIQRLAPLVAAGTSDDPEMQKFYDKMRKVTEGTL